MEPIKKSATTEYKLLNNSFEIFNNGGNYVDQLRFYFGYFNELPNIKIIKDVDNSKLQKWCASALKESIVKENYKQIYCQVRKKNIHADLFYILCNNIVINIYSNSVYILFNPTLEQEAQDLQNLLLRFTIKKRKTTEISLIISAHHGLDTKKVDIKKPKLNFDLHYNDDFAAIHAVVLKNMTKRNSKGLYLFHGLPGTGKSTYIKYLIHQQSKEVIFLSPKLASSLDDFALTEFLIDNPNCVLVIEDAEDLILSRDNHNNSKLSFLLNLTDGLLGESLGIQIIATFNTDLKNIDKALLRKGRLTSIYEFKPLTQAKTNNLLQSLGHEITVNQSLSLADIFNFETENNYEPILRKAVGFGN